MKKSITVYELKTETKSVNFPTESAANKSKAVLTSFGIESELNKTKKVVEI